MNVANIQAAYYMMAATGVLIAAIFHIINLRSTRRAREMEIVRLHTSDFVSEQGLRRYTTVMSLKWKDYEDYVKKYGPSNPEIYPQVASHFLMMEASGILIKNKVVKSELFYDLGGFGAIETWEKFKDLFQRWRKDVGQEIYRNAEFFVQEMQKIKTKNEARVKETQKPSYGVH